MIARLGFGCVTLALVVLTGCGGPAAVESKGFIKWDDGTPIASASIRLVPTGTRGKAATAVSGADGAFTLTTDKANDGAIPGEYKVVVTKISVGEAPPPTGGKMTPEEMAKMAKEMMQKGKRPPGKSEIPALYSDEKSTPETLTISGPNPSIEIKLKKN